LVTRIDVNFHNITIHILVPFCCHPLSVSCTSPLFSGMLRALARSRPSLPTKATLIPISKVKFTSTRLLYSVRPELNHRQTSIMGPANARKASNGLPEGEMIFHSSELSSLLGWLIKHDSRQDTEKTTRKAQCFDSKIRCRDCQYRPLKKPRNDT